MGLWPPCTCVSPIGNIINLFTNGAKVGNILLTRVSSLSRAYSDGLLVIIGTLSPPKTESTFKYK